MKYLLDTDVASYYLRGKYDLVTIFEKKGIHNIRISRVTVAELEVLAHRNPQSKINLLTVYTLSESLGILEVDKETWNIFAKVKADTLNRGKPKGDLDILIASMSLQYQMMIVTNNVSHYEDIAKVENWTRQ
jgi:tRNA(fMet)-specific endonuclease VapC